MADVHNPSQVNYTDRDADMELSLLWRDMLRGFGKLWWVAAVLAALLALAGLFYSVRSYHPMYRAEATFTVETYTNQNGYTFFYDNNTAAQMAITFPYLLDSDLLLDRVMADMGVEYLNGTPSAQVIENSNLFTLSVTSRDPQAAYDILQSLIKNYPAVAEYVIGRTQLNMIDYPEFPTLPYNHTQHLKYAGIGGLGGLLLGLFIVALYAWYRNTVRKETDITEKLQIDCLGSVPWVVPKNRRKDPTLSIRNRKIGPAFKESFRGLALQVDRAMEDKRVLLVTSTVSGEGVSTVAANLAEALKDRGRTVALVDGTDPAAIDAAAVDADMVIVDAPACHWMDRCRFRPPR